MSYAFPPDIRELIDWSKRFGDRRRNQLRDGRHLTGWPALHRIVTIVQLGCYCAWYNRDILCGSPLPVTRCIDGLQRAGLAIFNSDLDRGGKRFERGGRGTGGHFA